MKIFKTFLIFVLVQMVSGQEHSNRQQDTIYYNDLWQVTTKDNAAFYRPPVHKKGELYRIEDYFVSGQLQMSGLSKSPVKNNWEGLVTWYNEDGTILQQGHYKNNRLDGEFITFLNNKKLVAIYKDGYFISGQRNTKNANNQYFASIKNDTVIDMVYDKDPDGIRYENYSKVQGANFLSKYYDENGELIGKREILKDGYVKGVEVFYYYNPMRVKEIRYSPFGRFLGTTTYYPNGQVRTRFEQTPVYKKTYYNPDGAKMGEMTYRLLDNDRLKPVTGTEYYFPYSYKAEEIGIYSSIRTYEAEKLIKEEFYYENGKLKTVTTFNKANRDKELQVSYDETGKEIARMTYKGYYPFDGTEIIRDKQATYKDGELVEEINFYPKTKIVFSRMTKEKEDYFDTNGNLLGTLKLKYENKYGKPMNGERFYTDYNSGDISSIEVYKNGYITKRTSFRKRKINETESKVYKNVEYYLPDSYKRSREVKYYSNGKIQSDISYEGYDKTLGKYYNESGELLGAYDYKKKDGKLYEFFDDSDELRLMKQEKEGQLQKLRRYDYGPNNRYGSIDPVLVEEFDIDCCSTSFTRKGAVIAEASFKDGKPWSGTIYDHKSRVKLTVKEGKRNGTYQKLDYNQESVLEEGQYINDKREGIFKYYNYTGQLEKQTTFNADKLNGQATYYNKNGDLIATMIYKEDLPYNGTLLIKSGYNKNPTEETYKDGLLVQRISYDENGGKRVSNFKDGKETETTAYHKDTDKKRLTYSVTNYYVDGEVLRFDKNGNEQNRAVFEKNKLKSGTVFLTPRDLDKRVEYIILTKKEGQVRVIFKDENDNTLFSAEEQIEPGYSSRYIDKMNLYISYLYPDRLY